MDRVVSQCIRPSFLFCLLIPSYRKGSPSSGSFSHVVKSDTGSGLESRYRSASLVTFSSEVKPTGVQVNFQSMIPSFLLIYYPYRSSETSHPCKNLPKKDSSRREDFQFTFYTSIQSKEGTSTLNSGIVRPYLSETYEDVIVLTNHDFMGQDDGPDLDCRRGPETRQTP